MEIEIKPIAAYIGRIIKEKRKNMRIPARVIAEYLKISHVSMYNIENGRSFPGYDKLALLCALFKCQMGDIFPKIEPLHSKIKIRNVTIKKIKRVKSIVITNNIPQPIASGL